MVIVIILCGGIGTNVHSPELPKQFINLPGEKYNLFEQTIIRSQQLSQQCTHLIVVSHISVKQQVNQAIHNTNIQIPITLIWEPVMRNTGPAIGCLVKYIQKYPICDKDQKCIIFPSDHILSIDAFNRSLTLAEQYVESNIVTFGVYPKYPETNYGYIIEGDNHKISKFIEKPSYDIAKQLINDPMCYWNSGLYYAKIGVIIDEYIGKSNPLSQITIAEYQTDNDHLTNLFIDSQTYQLCSNIPFDKLIMEKTRNGCIVPFRGLWSDIGSWESIYQVSQQYKSLDCHEVDTKNCHIFNYNQKQIVALVGIEDICVVNTKDAVLISKLSESNKVKELAQLLEDQYTKKHLSDKPTKYVESLGINVSILFMIILSYLRMDLDENHKIT